MVLASIVVKVLAFSRVALAAPTTNAPKYYSLNQLARNDPNIIPIVDASPINLYLDISYSGFIGVSAALPVVAGIRPQSPNKEIGYGKLSTATITQGKPSMTTVYQDSTVEYLDLVSFYFGCTTRLGNSEAAKPAGCSVIAECISPQGTSIAKQSFAFKLTSGGLTPAIVQDMALAEPTGFKGCQKVKFNTVFADALGTPTGLNKIKYTVYSKQPLI